MKNLLFKFFLVVFIFDSYYSFAQWPVNNGNQGNITGTVGELRSAVRTHNGIDVTGDNTQVCSIKADKIKTINYDGINNTTNSIVMESGVQYIHVNFDPTQFPELHLHPIKSDLGESERNEINDGIIPIPLGQGKNFALMVENSSIKWPIHVHMQNDRANFLNGGYGAPDFNFYCNFTPTFGPNVTPDIPPSSGKPRRSYNPKIPSKPIKLYRDKTTHLAKPELFEDDSKKVVTVWGDVDIVAHTFQYRINSNGSSQNRGALAPYKIGYGLTRKSDNQEVCECWDRFKFDVGLGVNSAEAMKLIHATNEATQEIPLFVISNKFADGKAEEDAWKTRDFDEGLYTLTVKSQQAGASPLLPSQKTVDVRVDNYMAYIMKVIIKDNANQSRYVAQWSGKDSDGKISFVNRISESFDDNQTVQLDISTSEEVSDLTLKFGGSEVTLIRDSEDKLLWTGSAQIPPSTKSSTIKLVFTSTDKLYGLEYDDLSANVARKKDFNNSLPTKNFSDNAHKINVCPSGSDLSLNIEIQQPKVATLVATGGQQPYKYAVDKGDFGPTNTFNVVADKTYLFSVKDKEGCTATKDYILQSIPCNTTSQPGGQGQYNYDNILLGDQPGTVTVSWDMYQIPDEIKISYRGKLLYSSGLVSGQNSYTFTHTPQSNNKNSCAIYINAPNPGTAWIYTVSCPVSGNPARLAAENLPRKTHEVIYSRNLLTLQPIVPDDATVYTLNYRVFGEKTWQKVSNVTLPYQLPSGGKEMEVNLTAEPGTDQSVALKAYPNPSTGPVTVEYMATKSGTASLSVVGIDGRTVHSEKVSVKKGANLLQWKPAAALQGALIINLQQDAIRHSTNILIGK